MEATFPKHMTHPAHAPAVNSVAAVSMGGAPNNVSTAQGRAERFPPIDVHNPSQEAYYASQGYLPAGAARPITQTFSEYPKMLWHPDHVDATPAIPHAWRDETGGYHETVTPGTPEKFPAVMVKDAAEQTHWEAKGWQETGRADVDAYETAIAAPYNPSFEVQQFPMLVNGVVVDPTVPARFQEYPKWVGDTLASNAAEEAAARAKQGLPDAAPPPAQAAPEPVVVPPPTPVPDRDLAAMARRATALGIAVQPTWDALDILDAITAAMTARIETPPPAPPKPKNRGGRPRKSALPPKAG